MKVPCYPSANSQSEITTCNFQSSISQAGDYRQISPNPPPMSTTTTATAGSTNAPSGHSDLQEHREEGVPARIISGIQFLYETMPHQFETMSFAATTKLLFKVLCYGNYIIVVGGGGPKVRGTFTFGKKDTSTDLYSIFSVKQNKIRSHAIGNQEVASGIDDGLRFEHGGQVSVRAERPRIGIGGLHGVGRGRQNSGAGGDHRGGVAAAEGDISCDILLQICENSAPKIYWHVTFDFVKTQIKGDELSTAIALRDLDTCQSKLVRILLFYALDPIVFYEGEKPPGREILETSARNLLLSDGTKVAVKNKEGVETAQEPALHTTWPYGSRTENEWRDKE
ncbi:hypothetical protein EV1_024273 [Malus domestica]